jgi:hypothetical protein
MRSFKLRRPGKSHAASLILLVGVVCLAGCGGEEGPPRAAARGQVTLDGQPLAEGVIRFIPAQDTTGPAAMATIRNGQYELDDETGPVLGSHRVEIEATGHHSFAIDDEAAFAAQVEQKGGRMAQNPVPIVYNRRSSLTAEIAADRVNELNFPLSSSGGQTAQR